MCSIFGVLDLKSDPVELRKKALELSRLMRHRGPDWSGVYASDKAILAHERLSIVDVNNGAQPLYNAAHTHVLAVNGEIYNHRALRQQLSDRYAFQTGSDCEVIRRCIRRKARTFSTICKACSPSPCMTPKRRLPDRPRSSGHHPAVHGPRRARQPVRRFGNESAGAGVPHHQGIPGRQLPVERDGEIREYYRRDWFDYDSVKDNVTDAAALRTALEESVKSHLMSDVPYGVLLSGGLDSSVISAITKKYAARRVEDQERSEARCAAALLRRRHGRLAGSARRAGGRQPSGHRAP